MKKFYLALMAYIACVVQVKAADGITIDDAIIPKGGETVVEVLLSSSDRSYGGFQFDVKLPQGVSIVKMEKAARLTAIENYTLQKSQTDVDNNVYTVLGYNTERQSIEGTSGAVAYLTLQASNSMTAGDVLSATVSNVVLSTVDEENIDAPSSSFTITVGEPADTRLLLDETSTTAPTSATGVDVRVKRTIMGGVWNTICLPFAMTEAQVKTAFGEGVQLASFTGWETTEYDAADNATSIKVTFEPTSAIEANTPYIIKLTNSITEFLVDGVDVAPDDEPSVTVGKKSRGTLGSFTGSYVPITIDEECLFLSEGNFWYSVGKTKMKGFRGYFYFQDLLASYTAGSNARVSMVFTEEPTGISEYGLHATGNGICYDLQGRRVVTPVHGLYIRDGKKVIVK